MKKRIVSKALREKLQSGGRKARQMSPMCASDELRMKRSRARKGRRDAVRLGKKDPDLQARIDMVVERALHAERAGNGVDVLFGAPFRARHGALKAFKVG